MLRIDRILTLSVFSFWKSLFPHPSQHIPILMYHSISNDMEKVRNPYFAVTTSPAVFESHIRLLAEKGYHACQLCNINESVNSRKKVVLTFDDGFEDFYSIAWPVLKKYGFSASVFLPTMFIDNESKTLIKGKKHLSWNQVRELKNDGVEFGSHSVSHSVLRTCSREVIKTEIVDSKRMIEKHVGSDIQSFSYPYAFPFDDVSLRKYLEMVVQSAGYDFAVSTRIGVDKKGSGNFFRPRLPVNNMDDLMLFSAKIRGCYDWMKVLQYIYKKTKNVF